MDEIGGCPGRLEVASQRVQTQWDDVDIWKRSSEDTTVGNNAKHRQKLRSLFGPEVWLVLRVDIYIYRPRVLFSLFCFITIKDQTTR